MKLLARFDRHFFSTTLVALLSFGMSEKAISADSLPDFAKLVEQNAATIVEIAAVQMVESQVFLSERDLEEFLRGRPNPEEEIEIIPEPEEPQLSPRGGVGSGFIISADGYIITNHHVVLNAEDITVSLTDRREYSAEVIGLDEPSDLALLKIDAQNLPFVKMGDSDAIRVGDWVLAIGSPFGLEFSAAAGIVSAIGRSVPGNNLSNYNYMSFLQSDVAINQGNSGGPLFNLDGEVIGINSQILSSSGGSNGISFSIPSNVALNVVSQLMETGRVQRGLLGVQIKEVTFALSQSFGLDRPRGAFVDVVSPDSPAERAGIQIEDIILEFNDRSIEYSADLPFFTGQNKPGTNANVVVFRNGERLNLSVTLGSSPTNTVPEVSMETAPASQNPLGLSVADLSREARQVSGLNGVRVESLNDGPAKDAGILEGDVIVSLNRQNVENMEQFSELTRNLPQTGFVSVRIVREGRGTTLALEMK